MSDETRLIHAGSEPQPLARTVGPPIQKGSTILLPNADALYDDDGQLTSGTFMDYLIPSALEVPSITIVDHCTPSPLTTFGQKGSGEAGYLGAPAAVANAVNDALAPLGVEVNELPIAHLSIFEALCKATPGNSS